MQAAAGGDRSPGGARCWWILAGIDGRGSPLACGGGSCRAIAAVVVMPSPDVVMPSSQRRARVVPIRLCPHSNGQPHCQPQRRYDYVQRPLTVIQPQRPGAARSPLRPPQFAQCRASWS